MTIPSFEKEWVGNQRTKPRIQVLEVRDKKLPDGDPIAWLLVERQESYKRDQDGSVYEASIDLSYKRIMPRYARHDVGQGRFDGYYSRLHNRVSITSDSLSRGAVFLDLPGLEGHRVGTYLMNEIVTWLRRHWPDAAVNSVELRSEQGFSENKERRNKFWEQFGLVFDYTDSSRKAGFSRPMLVKELTQIETWQQNIIEHSVLAYLADVLYTKERVSLELQDRVRAIENLVEERRRVESRPMRWALKMLYYNFRSFMPFAIALIIMGAALWWRFRLV